MGTLNNVDTIDGMVISYGREVNTEIEHQLWTTLGENPNEGVYFLLHGTYPTIDRVYLEGAPGAGQKRNLYLLQVTNCFKNKKKNDGQNKTN